MDTSRVQGSASLGSTMICQARTSIGSSSSGLVRTSASTFRTRAAYAWYFLHAAASAGRVLWKDRLLILRRVRRIKGARTTSGMVKESPEKKGSRICEYNQALASCLGVGITPGRLAPYLCSESVQDSAQVHSGRLKPISFLCAKDAHKGRNACSSNPINPDSLSGSVDEVLAEQR